MRHTLVILIALLLSGCSLFRSEWSYSDAASAQQEAISAANQCASGAPNYESMARCSNAAMLRIYSNHGYPYMDLIQMVTNENYAIGIAIDQRRLTVSQGQTRLSAAYDRLTQIENQRNAAHANRRALAAGIMLRGLQNATAAAQRAYQPPPSTNCTTTWSGGTAYTHCQ